MTLSKRTFQIFTEAFYMNISILDRGQGIFSCKREKNLTKFSDKKNFQGHENLLLQTKIVKWLIEKAKFIKISHISGEKLSRLVTLICMCKSRR